MASPAERRAEPNGSHSALGRAGACRNAATQAARPESQIEGPRLGNIRLRRGTPATTATLKGPKEFRDMRDEIRSNSKKLRLRCLRMRGSSLTPIRVNGIIP